VLIVVSVEHTLAQGDDLRTAPAHRSSRSMYEALSSQFQLIALSKAPIDITRWWLKKEHMPKWAQIEVWEEGSFFEYPDWKVHKVGNLLSAAWEIAYYVDSDPHALSRVLDLGVSVLRVDHARNLPGWQDPESTAPRAWATLAVGSEPLDTGGDHGPG
jgi:hypothetical protein